MRTKIKSSEWRGQAARYAHLKLDGHYLRVVVEDSGLVRAYTSLPTDVTDKLPTQLLANVYRYVPAGTVLLGELTAPGRPASSVKTAINDGDCRLTYFAVETLTAEYPLELLSTCFAMWQLPFAGFRTLPEGWSPRDLMEEAAEMGAEGWVLKDGNLLNWRKLKCKRTVDLVVLDVEDGEGKYLGLMGSLVCGTADGRVICNASGMTDDERTDMSLTSPVGRVVEIEYQYVGSGGKLRHPRFKRFRDDKTPAECRGEELA